MPPNPLNQHLTGRIDWLATLAIIIALLFWSFSPPFIHYLTKFLDSWTQNSLRYAAASLFWLPFLLASIPRGRFDHHLWTKALIPTAANIIMQTCWTAALYRITPGFSSLLTKSSLFWIILFSALVCPDERPLFRSKRLWSGLCLCVIGVIGTIIFKTNFTATQATTAGIALALSTALTWAVYTVSARLVFRQTDARLGFAVIAIYTTIGLTSLAFIFGQPSQCLHLPLKTWTALIVSGIFSIALAHVLFYSSIKRIGATIPSLLLQVSPFSVLAISWLWFGETLTALQWIFGIILVAGAVLAIWAQQHLRMEPPPTAGPK